MKKCQMWRPDPDIFNIILGNAEKRQRMGKYNKEVVKVFDISNVKIKMHEIYSKELL